MLVTEKEDKQRERETTLSERVPPLKLSGLSVQELQVNYNCQCSSSGTLGVLLCIAFFLLSHILVLVIILGFIWKLKHSKIILCKQFWNWWNQPWKRYFTVIHFFDLHFKFGIQLFFKSNLCIKYSCLTVNLTFIPLYTIIFWSWFHFCNNLLGVFFKREPTLGLYYKSIHELQTFKIRYMLKKRADS